jgi:hypothetical protein
MLDRPFIVFVLLLVTNCSFHTRSAFADDVVKPVEAELVAKGDGYLVHVMPGCVRVCVRLAETIRRSESMYRRHPHVDQNRQDAMSVCLG